MEEQENQDPNRIERFTERIRLRGRKKEKELSNRQRKIREYTNRGLLVVLVGLVGIAGIYTIYTVVSGAAFFIPGNAKEVLESVEPDSSYGWATESIRVLKVADQSLEQQSARGALVNTEANKFMVIGLNVFPEPVSYTSDGKYTIEIRDQGDDDARKTLVTDVCAGKPSIPVSTVTMPSPEMILEGNPSIDSDKATIAGERAWLLDFEPTPETIRQMLMLDFFTTVAGDSKEANWLPSKEEQDLIAAGKYTVDNGKVWVNYNGNRQIQQIDVDFTIENGTRYRLLSQRTRIYDDQPEILNETDLGDPGCNRNDLPIAGE